MKPNLKHFPKKENYYTTSNGVGSPKGTIIFAFGKYTDAVEWWKVAFKRELQEKYAKLCETRIANIADDAVAFFIEELLEADAEEILGE